jgi:hypothetical protein
VGQQFPSDFAVFWLIIHLLASETLWEDIPSETSSLGTVRMTLDWKEQGVKIVHAGELDSNTPQTPGMTRAAAITYARTGANKLWAGTVVVQPHAKTGPHHHGDLETVI